ncbi:MAG: hypothetical protein JKY56_24985, partial [Kofleriaceae bacterium]|nr:hypothetical protein [Kofleriaceae bacterium]
NLEGALLAVSLNLQAYCQARQGRDLALALQLSREALKIRASVAGFRHTRGLLLLELGQLDDASRDLEASWLDGSGTGLFEAERCYDLGRLWSVRGQSEYGNDYFERSLRASPDSHWATMSEKLVSQSATLGIARGSGNILDDFI